MIHDPRQPRLDPAADQVHVIRRDKLFLRPMAPHDYVAISHLTGRQRHPEDVLSAKLLREFARKQWTCATVAQPYAGDLDGNASFGPIVGFMLHAILPDRFDIVDLHIDSGRRRRGIASLFVRQLTSRLSPGRRLAVVAEVFETDLRSQLFFKSQGFLCRRIIRRPPPKPDLYRFEFRASEPMKTRDPLPCE